MQPLLELAAVGDVEPGAEDRVRLALAAYDHRLVAEMALDAVGALPAILDRNGAGEGDAPEILEHALTVGGVYARSPESAVIEEPFGREAGQRLDIAAHETGRIQAQR